MLIPLFLRWPVVITLVSVGLVLLFYYKKYKFYQKITHKAVPENGDIIVYFTDHPSDLMDLVIWKGGLTLPSSIPVSHYSIMIDDEQFVENHHPDNKKFDELTGKIRAGIRVGKWKNIPKDWSTGPALVIKTNIHIDHSQKQKILNKMREGPYWRSGGCLGAINKIIKMCVPNHPNVIRPEEFIYLYGTQLGWIDYT